LNINCIIIFFGIINCIFFTEAKLTIIINQPMFNTKKNKKIWWISQEHAAISKIWTTEFNCIGFILLFYFVPQNRNKSLPVFAYCNFGVESIICLYHLNFQFYANSSNLESRHEASNVEGIKFTILKYYWYDTILN